MVRLPQNEIFEIYEKLRPGRAKSKGELISIARKLKEKYHALILASFVEEAADIYEKKEIFLTKVLISSFLQKIILRTKKFFHILRLKNMAINHINYF